ncbi:MAG: 16S rRNA (guanine(527)-N(7))-methyltransferase RsmG [Oscillospiraceae bacterium]|nr:16S rRNA (guanine(527)-N(7))-methyltransferase RsmG [Oscillospiraceae bacterium]
MIEFNNEQRRLLEKLSCFMLEYNKKVNLTAIKEPTQVWEKHFFDSAFPLKLMSENVPRGTSVIDVGTGAGFPGVVWKIYRPDLRITMLDSLRKRVDYLALLRDELGLEYDVVHGRSEELSLKHEYRERFGIAVSRAVAKLPALCEFCLPFVKIGGLMLAMKGPESENADGALAALGGETEDVKNYTLPSGDRRSLIIIRKVKETPAKFPRQRINISKNPLT